MAEVPRLTALHLEIETRTSSNFAAEPNHIRRIVVKTAPALFLLGCSDSRCNDGGHDITHEVMRQLRSGSTRFEGEDTCGGSVGAGPCSRRLHFVAVAAYNP